MWFTNVIKPTHICNLDCHYCYNEDTRHPVMPFELLERVIDQTLEFARSLGDCPSVDFIWHGGEPTVAGIDFYLRAIEIQARTAKEIRYANSIQTNGTLLNSDWIRFLKDCSFDVSLSLDGPEHIHDSVRTYRGGKGSFSHVMRAIRLLRDEGLPHGVCVVMSQANRDRVDEIFEFLAIEQLPFNVIPLTRSGGGLMRFDDLGLGPEEYAEPWIRLFDLWFESSGTQYVQCTDFVRKSRAILIGRPTDCIGQKQCASHHISTDPDGFVYPCATLSADHEWCYGNLVEMTLRDIMNSPLAVSARNREIDPHCQECKWMHVCHGGCMSRSIKFFGTHNTRDYYCPSLYKIYDHIESKLRSTEGLELGALPPEGMVDSRRQLGTRPLTNRRFGHVNQQLVQISASRAVR